jgi:predicted LPLAT superfamily acyltransferase
VAAPAHSPDCLVGAHRPAAPHAAALLVPITCYFVVTDGTARRASREFLSLAHGRRARWSEVFAHLYSFAATLLDRVWMARGEFERFDVTVEGDPLVEQALKSGKGCVLLGSHLGSFDLMTMKNKVFHDRPVTLLMHIDERARVRRIAGIDDGKLSIIPLGRFDSYLRAYEVLERGGIVVALADRAEGAAALPSSFFGRPRRSRSARMRWRRAPARRCSWGFGLYEGRRALPRSSSSTSARRVRRQPRRGAAARIDRYVAILEQYARRYPETGSTSFRTGTSRHRRRDPCSTLIR